ncbi:hypothetical protein ACYATO_08720 [Lactobacillaceae bacterium Melli_B3]
MLYIGSYHDHNGDLRLDFKSIDSKPQVTINQLYDDMTDLNYVDGCNAGNFVAEQLDELAQSECDLITLTDSDLEALNDYMD